MKWLLEMDVPDWHEDNAPNHILIVYADTFDEAVQLACLRLSGKCRGPKGWSPSVVRYMNITDDIGPVFDFSEQGIVPAPDPVCPCCKRTNVEPTGKSMFRCNKCGCVWDPAKEKDE